MTITESSKVRSILLIFALFTISLSACDILDSWMLDEIPNRHEFNDRLSTYELYKGKLSQLIPHDNVVEYDLTTPLFTDYAHKQRLIKLPDGGSIQVNNDGSFTYPDSTLIAKTFYYEAEKIQQASMAPSPALKIGFQHLGNTDSGEFEKRNYSIIETRLLFFVNGIWNVAVYEWNRHQTEASLINDGTKREVSWINSNGKTQTIRYRIPSLAECTTCHQSSNNVVPIGPKLANLNHDVSVENTKMNQLEYLNSIGQIQSFNTENINSFPEWDDENQLLEKRARAYLDVNCAHCHTDSGFADYSSLYLDYDLPLSKTGILSRKDRISSRLNSRWRGEKMPLIGTTLIHEEGVALIQEYLDNL